MVGAVRSCPLFTKMVDRLSPISSDTASALRSIGVGAVGRYLNSLTIAERDGLFAAGLGILPLTEAPIAPLTADVGRSYADSINRWADGIGVPDGVHLMVDFEAQHGDRADVLAYDESLTAGIAAARRIALAYVGSGQVLSGAELYSLPDVHLYWRAGSLKVPEPDCGFAIWQVPPLEQVVSGAVVDVSMTGADARGRRPILWWPS